jgi:hypothetical protein
MAGKEGRFSRRSNDNFLQLWQGRDLLNDDDIDPLRAELEMRGLTKEVEEISNQLSTRDIYGELPPGPWTYLNLSVPYWWLRELWLRHRTRNGLPVEAIIQSAERTRSRYWWAARAQLIYSYEFQGSVFSGQVIRDFKLSSADADSLVYDHHPGEKLPILVSPDAPNVSYYPSGMGFVEPILVGIQSLLLWVLVLGVARFIFV